MRRIVVLVASWFLLSCTVFAQSILPGFPPGLFVGRGAIDATPIAGYTGPGDFATFTSWIGLRAYSAAYAASQGPAIDITDAAVSGGNAATINVTTAGGLDTTTLDAWIFAHGTAYIVKFYDQTGNGNHYTNVVGAPYSQSPVGAVMNGVAQRELANNALTISQPFSVYSVAQSADTTNDTSGFWGSVFTDVRGSIRSTSLFGIYAGASFITVSGAAANAFHALSAVYNGASSVLNIDGGTNGSGDAGSNNVVGFRFARDGGGAFLTGYFREGGNVSGATSLNTSISSNMKTYWGF